MTLGLLVWGVTTAVGATILLAAPRTAFLVVKVCGVAYMGYVGMFLIVRTVMKDGASHAAHEAQAPAGSAWNAFGQGLCSNVLNPKVGVFYLAAQPQFMPAGTSHIAMGQRSPASTPP